MKNKIIRILVISCLLTTMVACQNTGDSKDVKSKDDKKITQDKTANDKADTKKTDEKAEDVQKEKVEDTKKDVTIDKQKIKDNIDKLKSTTELENSFNQDRDKIEKDGITIINEKVDQKEGTNKPIKLILKVDDQSVAYENNNNDGLYLYITDLDESDDFKDVVIISCGTDIGSMTSIYRYNDKNVELYAEINHMFNELTIDGNGMIYYMAKDDLDENGKAIIGTVFDYKNKTAVKLDKDIIELLNKTSQE